RIFQGGKNSENGGEIVTANVEKETDSAGGVDGTSQHEDQVLRLFAFPGVGCCGAIHDEDSGGFKNSVHYAETVGTQRGAGFRDFDDGIGKLGDFYFSCSPRKFDAGFDAEAFEIFFGEVND